SMSDGLCLLDEKWKIKSLNLEAQNLLQTKAENCIGKKISEKLSLFHDAFGKNLVTHEELMQVLTQDEIYIKEELHLKTYTGRAFPARVVINPIVHNNKYFGAILVFRDISHRKQDAEKLYNLSHYDLLTNLPNRKLFLTILDKTLEYAKRHNSTVAILYVDIDHFNKINEFHGQEIGDNTLVEMSKRLVEICKENDTIARISGDEYAIILDNIDHPKFAAKISNLILEKLNDPLLVNDHHINLHSSIGIAVYPFAGKEGYTLLTNANRAMQLAKNRDGNNFQYYTHALNISTERLLTIENHLRNAIQDNELYLNYQPQIEASTGRVVGLEALCRWKSQQIGLVSPIEFIPVAEESGLIVTLGEWVIKSSVTQYIKWRKKYPEVFKNITLSINISPVQLHNRNIITFLRDLLSDNKEHHPMIQFEITETTLLNLDETTLDSINFLKNLNIGLSIDDFGAGYSSLFYLKRLPITELKIDRSFVKDIPTNPDSIEIVRAIIQLGSSLNLKIVAEGVESQEQFDFFAESSCNIIQGYYFRPPLSPKQTEEYIINNYKDK
nr:EAL domain-containing protein [Gammaproteobacteria bacterium]